jgi:hypothetical protein
MTTTCFPLPVKMLLDQMVNADNAVRSKWLSALILREAVRRGLVAGTQ